MSLLSDQMSANFEIVGLLSGTIGRSCIFHNAFGCRSRRHSLTCSLHISIEGSMEEAVKCVQVADKCVVAFFPHAIATLPSIQEHLYKTFPICMSKTSSTRI